MLKKSASAWLCLTLLFPDALAAQPLILRPGAAVRSPLAAVAAPPSAARALERFSRWLAAPGAALVLKVHPALAGLRGVDFASERGRRAIAPLAERLPAEALPRLAAVAELPQAERELVLAQFMSAYQSASEAVNGRVAGAVANLSQEASTGRLTVGELEALAAEVESLAFYGPLIPVSAGVARETAARLRSAMAEGAAGRELSKLGAPRAQAGFPMGIETFKLENGLTVVLAPDHASPTVAVSITYKVGSVDERPGRSGFAHLFEHLMAQGTRNLRPREISKLVEHNGGSRNAFTTKTNTTYHSVVPKAALKLVLWAESDRMQSLDVDARALALEQQVVLEEMRRTYLNQPYRRALDEGMGSAVFSRWENRHTVIGEAEDIRNARLQDVRDFYRDHYAPNNAVLALAGDLTLEEAKRLAERYFGRLQPRTIAPPPDLAEPPIPQERRAEIADPLAKLPRLMIGWRAPERGTRDYWALTLLAGLLSGGEENPLYQALVKSARSALSASANYPWWTGHSMARGPDIFGLDVMMKLGATVPRVLAEADKVLSRFIEEGPTEEELSRVKAQAEYQWYGSMESLTEKAKLLSSYAALIGDPKGLREDLESLLSLTARDVRDAARRWLGGGRAVVHVSPVEPQAPAAEPPTPPIPEETPRAPGETPPPLDPAQAAPLPRMTRFSLPNGLKVVFVRDERLPLLEARLSMPAGTAAEAAGEDAVAEATARLLFKGTPEADGAAIAKALAALGWSAEVDKEAEYALVSAAGLARNAGPFFRELAAVLGRASFPEREVSLWKENMAQRLKALRASPEFMMGERMKSELFGAGHPYGKPFMTDSALAGLSSERLAAFRARAFTPRGATLVVAGDMEPAEARRMLEESLGSWVGSEVRSEAPPMPELRPSRLVLVDRPGSRQANLTISQTAPINRRHPDFMAFMAANHILGGSSTSRLFLNLRVDKGYTYGAYSGVSVRGQGLSWVVNAETRSEVALASLQEMQKEIRRMRDEPVPEETLAAAKRQLAGLFAIRLSALDSSAGYLWRLEVDGVDPASELASYVRRLEALTPADIQRAARTYLDPARMVTIAVGDRATLEPLLAPYRP